MNWAAAREAAMTATGRICPKCRIERPFDAYRDRGWGPSGQCVSCRGSQPSASTEAARRGKLKHRYRITQPQYDALLVRQGGMCAICGRPQAARAISARLYVDHDHETGEVRGLLCLHCNAMLGCANDDPEVLLAAIVYLRERET
jgi:hypothetical protein